MRRGLPLLLASTLLAASCTAPEDSARLGWTAAERRVLADLSLDSLPPPPPDPSNAVADDPRAVALGHALFFDEALSRDGSVSCATCHDPQRWFTDGRPLSQALGTTKRHAPTVVGAAWQNWFFWDGRADSQWAQALGPLEHADEHGATRTLVAQVIAGRHREAYQELFGPLPLLREVRRFARSAGPLGDEVERAAWKAMAPEDREAVNEVFANAGKALAAYQRRLRPGRAPFDDYVAAVAAGDAEAAEKALDDEAVAGLELFIGEAGCVDCHSGPLFTNREFHAVGVPSPAGADFDRGRADGALAALESPFNCLGAYSDASEEDCVELRFLKTQGDELLGAMKVPTLRGIAETAPYMHAGQKTSLREVLLHYVSAPVPAVGHTDLSPLALTETQMRQLEAFLRSLSAPVDAPDELLTPPPES